LRGRPQTSPFLVLRTPLASESQTPPQAAKVDLLT
jgi:hypothetical protein